MNGAPSAPHRRKREARSRIFRELVHIAAEQGASISLGVSTADALQECLDRAVALWRFACDEVDNLAAALDPDEHLSSLPPELDPLFEVIPNPQGPDVVRPHRYVTMEREARLEIEKLAAMMTQLGIAERVVRVKEAEAALYIAAIREAALEAGIPNEQVRLFGAALRNRLIDTPAQSRQPVRGTVSSTASVVAESRAIEKSIEEID